jgi:hypothetical protein
MRAGHDTPGGEMGDGGLGGLRAPRARKKSRSGFGRHWGYAKREI